jgi:hypothetical protein
MTFTGCVIIYNTYYDLAGRTWLSDQSILHQLDSNCNWCFHSCNICCRTCYGQRPKWGNVANYNCKNDHSSWALFQSALSVNNAIPFWSKSISRWYITINFEHWPTDADNDHQKLMFSCVLQYSYSLVFLMSKWLKLVDFSEGLLPLNLSCKIDCDRLWRLYIHWFLKSLTWKCKHMTIPSYHYPSALACHWQTANAAELRFSWRFA